MNNNITDGSNFLGDIANAGISNMSTFFTFVTAMLIAATHAQLGFISNAASKVQNNLGTVKHVVDKTVITIAASQCGNVKKIFGIDYDGYEGNEPNLADLTLNFITKEVKFTYKLEAAASLLPLNPWFNSSLPITIYMHGFTDDPSKESYANIGEAFISQGNFNVVALDASSLIRFLYLRSSTMVEYIGEALAKMLATLYVDDLAPENIHLIGHSLGSHIAGFTGQTFFKLTGKRIGRITGLDPAGPCFSSLKEDKRLSKNHADFVCVIHTDNGVYGLDEQIGHVDFYPNGGYQQPNCVLQTCSHSRVWQLFAESVVDWEAFIGVSCSDYASFRAGKCDYSKTSVMGYKTLSDAEGKYFLQTNVKAPYGLGAAGIVYDDNRGTLTKVVNGLKILKK